MDTFKQPNLYDRFNLRKDTPLPAGIHLSDFTIYSTTVKEREIAPVPMDEEDQNIPGMIRFKNEEFVVFSLKNLGVLSAIDDTDTVKYKNTKGFWVSAMHLHLEVNNKVPGFYFVGAQWTPSNAKIIEDSIVGWWWIFTLRDPNIEGPENFICGGYVFEKEEDAICLQAALDVK